MENTLYSKDSSHYLPDKLKIWKYYEKNLRQVSIYEKRVEKKNVWNNVVKGEIPMIIARMYMKSMDSSVKY